MGFGTLFVGYFLLLNIAYYAYTDLIAALLMTLGLYKLSTVNTPFRFATYISIAFSCFGLFELIEGLIELLDPTNAFGEITPYISITRYVIIGVLTVFILKGICEVAGEVGLTLLSKRASIFIPVVITAYLVTSIFEIPALSLIISPKILVVLAFFTVIFNFILVCMNLITIYTAYMKICMPEEVDCEPTQSKFAFVNKFREHRMQKEREYAEYKLEKLKAKHEKSKNKNQNKKKK